MIAQAVLCLVACVVGWVAAVWIMWQANPMTRVYVRKFFSRDNLLLILGTLGFFIAVCAMLSCAPYRSAQSTEPPACRDEVLAAIVAECSTRIKMTEGAERAAVRAACDERIAAWERCE